MVMKNVSRVEKKPDFNLTTFNLQILHNEYCFADFFIQ